ncbi:cell division cycle protein cdt2 [Mycena rosella]|uniref:Cell division cycle protein cdt2 n=1 Tax=Mycena rosella TaxID=1033263 RepID=A0AAD7DFS8_MYCRO|nr:cell division cycle protein cdt2 [Mycena rosella]
MPVSKSSPSQPRGAFGERTNLQTPGPLDASSSIKSWLAGPKRAQCKRPSNENDGGDRKRVKISSEERNSPCGSDSDAYESDSDVEMMQHAPCHRLKTASLNSASQRPPVAISRRPFVSTWPILQSFVSSNKSDVFRCQSVLDGSFLAPPYACAYSHSARSGGTPLLAVATEQGTVYVVDTSKRKNWDPEPVVTTFQPHNNGIFDVKWNMSDTLLATVSGDRLARISDLETGCTVQTLRGHQGTVKCVSWDPTQPELLSTGGRDGLVCIWDLRVGENRAEQGPSDLHPVLTISAAHEDTGPNGKRKTPKGKRAPMPKSVTGLIYSDANPYHLISSGSSDGILRCWDLRLSKSKSTKVKEPPCLFSSPLDPTTFQPSSRPRGIISLVDGTGPTAGLCFALCADSRIHTYGRDSLAAFGNSYTHENLQTNFYVKLAASPCGRWLATGGSGVSGSSFMFDVSNATRASPYAAQTGVELKGHAGDAGGVDWASGMLSTCWDDGMVRLWRPDTETHMACVENPEEQRWDWCWAGA